MPWYEYSAWSGGRPLPLAEIRLWHGMRSVRFIALVDSGADFSLLNVTYADELGLDRDDAERGAGVGASGSPIQIFRWSAVSLEIQIDLSPDFPRPAVSG
jgi:hypothetical protein